MRLDTLHQHQALGRCCKLHLGLRRACGCLRPVEREYCCPMLIEASWVSGCVWTCVDGLMRACGSGIRRMPARQVKCLGISYQSLGLADMQSIC